MTEGGEGAEGGVDASGWPVVVVTVDEGLDEAGARAVAGELDDLLARARQGDGSGTTRLGLVFDYHRGRPEAQQVVSRWMAERIELLGRLVAGAAIVVGPDSVDRVRAMIETGAFPVPFPAWAAASPEACQAWVRDRLA